MKDWKNISAIINVHQKIHTHLENRLKWRELEIRIKKHANIDEKNLALVRNKEKHRLLVLERLLLFQTLAIQN